MNVVLIVGSAPDALRIKSFDLSAFTSCVAINNAWRLKNDWDFVIYPEDFPIKNHPKNLILKNKMGLISTMKSW